MEANVRMGYVKSGSSQGPILPSRPVGVLLPCDCFTPDPTPSLPGPKERLAQNHLQALPALYSSLRDRRTDRQCSPRRRPASLAPWTRHQAQPSPWYLPGKIPVRPQISTSDSSRPNTHPPPSLWKQPNKLKGEEQKHPKIRKRGTPPPE